jgi:DNA polymerase V
MRFDALSPFFIPRLTEAISAGFPSAAEGYEDEPLNLHEWIVRNPPATFFFRVQGEALYKEHIRDGSVVVVDRSITPTPGRLVLVEDMEKGEFVVMRFHAGVLSQVRGVVTAVVTKV